MPRFEEPPVVMGTPCNQTQATIYDLPVADLIPTTIQSSSKDNLEKPLWRRVDIEMMTTNRAVIPVATACAPTKPSVCVSVAVVRAIINSPL